MERTITSTSGRPGAGSLEKWSMALKPFLSYTVSGEMLPAETRRIGDKVWTPLCLRAEQLRQEEEQQEGNTYELLQQALRPSGAEHPPVIYISPLRGIKESFIKPAAQILTVRKRCQV